MNNASVALRRDVLKPLAVPWFSEGMTIPEKSSADSAANAQ
jgi:hypothetical protein